MIPQVLSDRFRERWFGVVLVAVLYTVLELPFDIAFDLPPLPWMVFDALVVIVFCLDIAVNFRLPYLTEENEWVRSPALIRANYLRTWFLYDVLSALPVDFIVLLVTENSSHPVQLIRLLKVLRLFRAVKLLNNVDIKGLPGWLQLWFLCYLFVLLAHWCACVFWKIAILEGPTSSWIALYQGLNTASVYEQYVQSLYWAVSTVTTLGYGDVHPVTFVEYAYVICVIFIGAACYAVIIAAIGGHFVSSRFAAKTEYNRYTEALEAYEQYHNLPVSLRTDVERYCDHIWKRRKTFLNDNVVRSLPRSMREAISNAICAKIVKGSRMLCECTTKGFTEDLVAILQPVGITVPGQVLFAVDEPITELYFVRRGSVEIRSLVEVENIELVVGIRSEGQHCGDQGLFPAPLDLSQARHEVSGVCDQFGDVFSVSIVGLLNLLRRYPRESLLFELVAKERKLACEEVMRLYETTPPEIVSNDGKGRGPLAWCARGRRRRGWAEIWQDVVSPQSDLELIDRVLQMPELTLLNATAIRAINSIDGLDDGGMLSNKGFAIPRAIGGIYRSFGFAQQPTPGAPQQQYDVHSATNLAANQPAWSRKRLPSERPKVPEFTGDVYERLEKLEAQVGEVVDMTRKIYQQQLQMQPRGRA